MIPQERGGKHGVLQKKSICKGPRMRGERKLGAAPERPCITWGQPQLCPPHHYTLLGLCPVHRSENPMDNLSFVSHSHPPRLFISHCISLFLRFHEPSAKWLHTINELGVTDPNLRLTPSRMFPLGIFIGSEDMCGQSMLFSDL